MHQLQELSGRQLGERAHDDRLLGRARTEVYTWQPVLHCNFLSSQVLLHGDRVVGAAFHRGVVGDNHDFLAVHTADTSDNTTRWHRAIIQFMTSKR